jgi:hypothetical protein
VMVFSPERWFELPPYLAFRGAVKREMLSTPFGRFQIRALGLILVVFICWMVFSVVSGAMRK